jgi:hypothetical protein
MQKPSIRRLRLQHRRGRYIAGDATPLRCLQTPSAAHDKKALMA